MRAPFEVLSLTHRVLAALAAVIGIAAEVRLEHAIAFYRNVPDCELAIIPGTSHGLLVEKPTLCDQIMLEFLTEDPVPTMAPRRRT